MNIKSLLNIVEFTYAEELGDEKFDIVLSKNSLNIMMIQRKFIFTMKKNMKKEGIMVIGF